MFTRRAGVLGGQQHGVTQIIHTCDADDPACTFQTSKSGFMHGQWVSNLDTERDRRMEVHVRSDLRQGSSYEDDVGEGTLAGIHKTVRACTHACMRACAQMHACGWAGDARHAHDAYAQDEKGVFHEWTPRPPRFREREYSRVRVGVPDADGMDSWSKWRNEHPDRLGHGNLPPHPTQYPTTAEGVVFRGPISQVCVVCAISIHPSIYLSIYPSIYPSVYLSMYVDVYPPTLPLTHTHTHRSL